ncbi:sporulation protein YunB [Clostridium argentinense CDC 2741]|uniref:Sporulation protein YunB n=1 Tax=Clostridium argentinense CDC 2741 TaxID=1418104 RepID=A0A0C1U425_9CLOT|nr:sporulation protein YunB [Clostridium argentinense]ARC84523.1 sporulation protein YunB [Clostridium argentinense]KIE47544.1 sporulation protein YunB [Clostridium argentinense CDC 2741]NFF38693.1 sporulation protein YunB [Clostridium argentinense]NFP48918.1 sporulation protein YunB [Clostridium argentinense]NFP72932.1 sporulation protein YunB [Clostridium argentinense]
MKIKVKIKIISIIVFICTVLIAFLYYFDEVIVPNIMVICDGEMRAKATDIINKSIIEEYINQFKYDEIINFEKDLEGNIILLKADTLKMNKIATDVALRVQRDLKEIGQVGIEFPIGYITKNNLLSNLGPNITATMQPVGHVETRYISDFESAGINQTRHKIYVEVKAKIKVVLPIGYNEVEVISQLPITETVIVGKIPETSVQLDLNSGKVSSSEFELK